MSSQAVTSNTEAAILARLIQSRDTDFAPEVARYLLAFKFEPADVARMNELAERAQLGQLTNQEQAELDSYLHVSNLLAVMQSKARRLLRDNPHTNK
ncbi:MAG: hypothetical protein DMF60_13495 [Acidobacteria bacterium]|nr:MAG: hypothetical protein DMF60_13495 [Acidobacteriota bacterium]